VDAGGWSPLFQEVNDRIYELVGIDGWDGDGDFLCECGADCGSRVTLSPTAFLELRRTGRPILGLACAHVRVGAYLAA
jgi:hypothetical protein